MPLIEVTDETFSGFVMNTRCVLTFTSPWCSACKKLHPLVVELAHEFKDRVTFGVMDISASQKVPVDFKIFSLPAALLFVRGKETRRFTGSFSINDLKTALLGIS